MIDEAAVPASSLLLFSEFFLLVRLACQENEESEMQSEWQHSVSPIFALHAFASESVAKFDSRVTRA